MPKKVSTLKAVQFALILSPVAATAGFAQSTPSIANAPIPAQFDIPAVRAARDACISDVQRLCPNVVPGGGRIVRCLAGQQNAMSPACREAVATARAAAGF